MHEHASMSFNNLDDYNFIMWKLALNSSLLSWIILTWVLFSQLFIGDIFCKTQAIASILGSKRNIKAALPISTVERKGMLLCMASSWHFHGNRELDYPFTHMCVNGWIVFPITEPLWKTKTKKKENLKPSLLYGACHWIHISIAAIFKPLNWLAETKMYIVFQKGNWYLNHYSNTNLSYLFLYLCLCLSQYIPKFSN